MASAYISDKSKSVQIYFKTKSDREAEHKFVVNAWKECHDCIEVADQLNEKRGAAAKEIFDSLNLAQKGYTYCYELRATGGYPIYLSP